MKDISQIIGERIRYYRKAKDLSQEELAYNSSLHAISIGRIERGEGAITVENLAKITQALGISLEEFFSVIDPKNNLESNALEELISLLSGTSKEQQEKALQLIKVMFDVK